MKGKYLMKFHQFSDQWKTDRIALLFIMGLIVVGIVVFAIGPGVQIQLRVLTIVLLAVVLLPILELLRFFRFHSLQDIAFRTDGVEWPIKKISFSWKRKHLLVPYDRIGKCIIGTGISGGWGGYKFSYLYIVSRNGKCKYLTHQPYLDLEQIRKILEGFGVKVEKGSFDRAVTLYSQGIEPEDVLKKFPF